MTRQYIPFVQIKNQACIIVDSIYPRGLILAHWRGAATPPAVRGDTSADIVLNALLQNIPELNVPFVSANHFDIDGFVGVWALLHPELALQHEEVLRQMARIGDFRELDLSNPAADRALQLVCWINAKEQELFYPPFGTEILAESEIVASVPKFEYFLKEFAAVLSYPEKVRSVWEPEYNTVITDYQLIHHSSTQVQKYPDLGLVLIRAPRPVHYYALFSQTVGSDIVFSQFPENRYELEYKYTTWIDLASRPTLPRVSLKPLAQDFNKLETAPGKWHPDAVTDTGPLLRLNTRKLSKMERYGHPSLRIINNSGIDPALAATLVVQFFQRAYANLKPKKYWTWPEIKALPVPFESKT